MPSSPIGRRKSVNSPNKLDQSRSKKLLSQSSSKLKSEAAAKQGKAASAFKKKHAAVKTKLEEAQTVVKKNGEDFPISKTLQDWVKKEFKLIGADGEEMDAFPETAHNIKIMKEVRPLIKKLEKPKNIHSCGVLVAFVAAALVIRAALKRLKADKA